VFSRVLEGFLPNVSLTRYGETGASKTLPKATKTAEKPVVTGF
jgi:hypothetical protein